MTEVERVSEMLELSFSLRIPHVCILIFLIVGPIFNLHFLPFSSEPSSWRATNVPGKKERPNLVSLVLLDLLPKAGVLLDADLLRGVELIEAAQVHVLGEQRDHVLVKGLPVRVLEVVPMGKSDFAVLHGDAFSSSC